MYSLKENAAAALKLSVLHWSVQCYIFVVLKNKTHQQINRLIVSWFSQGIFRIFLLIYSNSPCTETRSIPAYVSCKVSWKHFYLFVGFALNSSEPNTDNQIMFCLLVWLVWRHKLCRCHLWSETLIMASCKFRLETVRNSWFSVEVILSFQPFFTALCEVTYSSPFAIVIQENTTFAGGRFLNYWLSWLLHGSTSKALPFLRALGSICMQKALAHPSSLHCWHA